MSGYIHVPEAPKSPVVGPPTMPGKGLEGPPRFHAPMSRDFAPIQDDYPEASGLFKGASRVAQRAAQTVGLNRYVESEIHPAGSTERTSSLGDPSAYAKPTSRHQSYEAAAPQDPSAGRRSASRRQAAPQEGLHPALSSRAPYQPPIDANSIEVRPRMYRGAAAISSQAALTAGPAAVRQERIEATHRPHRPQALNPATQSQPTRDPRLSKRGMETLPGVDWSKY